MKAIRGLPFNLSVFLVLALIVSLLCGLIYVLIHQAYRQSANDPQIQISEDMARYLAEGKDVKSVMPPTEVDISKNAVWFLMVFDSAGQLVASNAKLDGQTPVVPSGVLEHARANGQNRVTWEPKDGVRIASVVTAYEGGSVLAGRSLREIEDRVGMLGRKVMMGWLLILVVTFAGTYLLLPKKLH